MKVRQALGDVLWRSELGIGLGDRRTPPEWVEDLAARFSALGIGPDARRPPRGIRLATDRACLTQQR